jgi:hypothetical protein
MTLKNKRIVENESGIPDYTLQRTHIGRGYGPVITETRQCAKLVCDGLNSTAPECNIMTNIKPMVSTHRKYPYST